MAVVKKIYILHGWTYTTENWSKVVTSLSNSGLDVTLLKVPGLTDGLERAWTLDDYVNWLENEIKGQDKIILIGHSNGGRIAIKFAVKNPSKIEKLILLDSAGIVNKSLSAKSRRKVFKIVAKIGRTFSSSPKLRKMLYKIARENDYQKASPIMRQTMANLISEDLETILEKISVPTIIIWGENDKSTPLKDAKTMNRKIDGSKMVVIEGAGHSPHISHSDEIVKIIKEQVK